MNPRTLINVILLTFITSGCASTAQKTVEQQTAEQAAIENPSQAAASGRFAIQQSRNLTDEQKIKFLALLDETDGRMAEIRSQEGQLKAALFQSLAGGKFQKKEIAVYKTKLKKVEDQKMELMFENLEKVNQILSGSSAYDPEAIQLYRAYMRE